MGSRLITPGSGDASVHLPSMRMQVNLMLITGKGRR
jgi:hypothetical protein